MAEVKITINEDGPYKVESDGTIHIEDHQGRTVPTREGRPVFLCRCGGSKNKPFCDGTHSKIGFAGAKAAVQAAEESS